MIGIMKPGVTLQEKDSIDTVDSAKDNVIEQQEKKNTLNNPSERLVTVFDDPDHYNCIHPLKHRWQWTLDRHDQRGKDQDSWGKNIKKIAHFESVEGFWGTYTRVMDYLNSLPIPRDCHLFKQGIRPEWEDPRNTEGGRLVIQSTVQQRGKNHFEKFCLETILLLIGETLEYTDQITGCFISSRRSNDRMAVWFSNYEPKVIESLRDTLLSHLGQNTVEIKPEKHGTTHSKKSGR